ncbi:MAG TPA: hypothetical protein VK617_15100 [Gemmatimonadaceae bacterium]|jgi:hypothetical protein|nr:hypothetical protein [Gemmatimonadaceae bacterium]
MIASLDKNPVSGEPPSLFAILAARARVASDATLAAFTAIGGVAAVALIAVRPRWWMYALLPVVAGAFGLWGILERGISERGANRSARYDRVIAAMQWLAVAIGTVAAIVTAFAVLGILLGPFIS